jgi:hypothetical protein
LSDEEETKRHCVRNVHELVESGVSNRFNDELDYLITGLESLPFDGKVRTTAARNTYLFDLGGKLFEDISPMRTSRLRSSGCLERIVKNLTLLDWDSYGKRFLILLLYRLCDDVRRIDHFIDFQSGLKLTEWLLSEEGTFVDPAASSRVEKLFQKSFVPSVR